MIQKVQIKKKGGSICFFGDWFGRPYDNFHRVKNAYINCNTNLMTIEFEGEVLTIKNPEILINTDTEFSIQYADEVTWEWYFYGKPASVESKCQIRYVRQKNDTCIKWYNDKREIIGKNGNCAVVMY